MNKEQQERAFNLLINESSEPLAWWWLSFCNTELPEGEQFLGACLVKANGFLGATLVARSLGCNPGGECSGIGPIPIGVKIQEGWAERLLTRKECEEFDRSYSPSC